MAVMPKKTMEHTATELNPTAWTAVVTKESAKASKELGVEVLHVITSEDAPNGFLMRASVLEALRNGQLKAWPMACHAGVVPVDPITKLATPIRKTEKGAIVL